MIQIGVVITDRGSAIATVERSAEDALLVTGLERLPFSLSTVADRVRALDDGEAHFVVDADGLGSALWGVLGHPDDAARWTLYAGRGLERQALVDTLLIAIEEGRFHFAPGLAEQDAMNRALLAFRRQVRDDGVVGTELVVALLLALTAPPAEMAPMVAWGYRAW